MCTDPGNSSSQSLFLLGINVRTEWSFDKAYFNSSRMRLRILDIVSKVTISVVW